MTLCALVDILDIVCYRVSIVNFVLDYYTIPVVVSKWLVAS